MEAALSLPRWEEQLFCYGDKCTLNDVVKMAEEATGAKFSVAYDGVGKLRKGEATELPSHPLAYAYFPKPILQAAFAKIGLYVINGLFDMPEEKSLNRMFPEIETMKVAEVVSARKGK